MARALYGSYKSLLTILFHSIISSLIGFSILGISVLGLPNRPTNLSHHEAKTRSIQSISTNIVLVLSLLEVSPSSTGFMSLSLWGRFSFFCFLFKGAIRLCVEYCRLNCENFNYQFREITTKHMLTSSLYFRKCRLYHQTSKITFLH